MGKSFWLSLIAVSCTVFWKVSGEVTGCSPEQEESCGLHLGPLKPLTGSAGAVSLKAWSPDQPGQQQPGALRNASSQDPALGVFRRPAGDFKASGTY